jgi:hypothetical protein
VAQAMIATAALFVLALMFAQYVAQRFGPLATA